MNNAAAAVQGHFQRGMILSEQGRYPEAEKHFREALGIDPENAQALYHLAHCQLQQKQQQKEALQTIGRAIELEPENSYYHTMRSFILGALDRSKEALKAAQESIGLDPTNDMAFCAKAAAHLQLQQWAEAEEAARKALGFDPENATAANQLAQALRLQNKMDENAEQIRGMLSRDPGDAYTHCTAGWSALQRGERKVAETHFLEALRLDPELNAAREGLLETFKARSPIYRAYLNYCFFMQRLGSGTQWAVILGLYFLIKFSRMLFSAHVFLCIVVVYFLLVLWVHVAQGVGNFFLLADRFARHALRRIEKIEACGVGGSVVLGLACLVAGLALEWGPAFVLGATFVGAAFPLSHTFTNGSRVGLALFGSMAAFVLLAGLANFAVKIRPDFNQPWIGVSGSIALFLVVLSTWISGFGFLRK